MLLSGEGVVPLAVRVFSRPIPGADDPSQDRDRRSRQ
jgi:hypothetical protein